MTEQDSSFFPKPQPGESGRPPRPPKMTARGLLDDAPEGESIIDEIARRLAMRFPDACVKRGADFIVFYPDDPNGFIVRLIVDCRAANPYKVYYDGSCEAFSSRAQAIVQFGFGLSNGCRLREYSRSGKAYRWVVELRDDETQSWTPDWDCLRWSGALRQFWRRPTVRYLQNHLIDLGEAGLQCAA